MAIGNSVNASQTGFQSLTAAGAWNGRTLTAGGGVSITNGDGTAGNPTVSANGASVSSVFAFKSATTNNVTGNSTLVTLVCDTESFDVGNNYNNATGIFTAPVAGKYFYSSTIDLTNIAATHTGANIVVNVNAGARRYQGDLFSAAAVRSSANSCSQNATVILDLSIGDTVKTDFQVSGGAQTVGLGGAALPSPSAGITFTSIFLIS